MTQAVCIVALAGNLHETIEVAFNFFGIKSNTY
jgi:hypothetical protein